MKTSITILLGVSFWMCKSVALPAEEEFKPIFFFNGRIYYLSTHEADVRSAVVQCEKAGFQLLEIQDKREGHNLRRKLMKLDEDLDGVWSSGQKRYLSTSSPTPEFVWIHGNSSSPIPMTYTEFAPLARLAHSRAARDRRSFEFDFDDDDDNDDVDEKNTEDDSDEDNNNTEDSKCGRCGCGEVPELPTPTCNNSPACSITLPECYTKTRDCILIKPNCTATRGPDCSSTCPPCTITPPECTVSRGPCKVTAKGDCTVNPPECTIETPACVTTRPNCTTIHKPCKPDPIKVPVPCPSQPPCRVNKGKLCSEATPPCKTFQPPCVSTTAACRNVTDETTGVLIDRICGETTTACPPPITTCPPRTTTCKPLIDCEPIYCTSPAMLCEEPRTHCPNPVTFCPPAIIKCGEPDYTCPQPIVECPEPEIKCTKPVAHCPGPEISCPGLVTHCTEAQTYCPPPIVICPDPQINCSTPTPCPEVTTPRLVQATCPPDTKQCDGTSGICPTRRPSNKKKRSQKEKTVIKSDDDSEDYARTECVGLNKEYGFKWDLGDCSKPRRFICEKVQPKNLNLYNDFTML